ncbi:N-acetyltransferase [Aureimonas sp. SA4125]|uniref:GNAT family N-acetyltransferase n=1 Tax=Aureimonas sp. SA4125 TaxID=2826993 RepID=UPI001CC81F6E|nr:GNAT family N-acetyltransferase [Aureimonas sp. SA4125]BDA86600.1 N-acetyltransferase [Aureimonas sp. SA4125]
MDQDFSSLLEDPLEPIATRRLLLRRPVAEDAPAMARLANDPGVALMLARLPHPYTIDHARHFLATVDRELVFAVTDAKGRFLGMCGLRPMVRPRTVDLGYWLGRPHWGKGIATEAAQAVIDLAFTRAEIDCVHANCRAINGASRRVLEKCGFQQRGTSTFVSVAAGRVAAEDFHLDRRAWAALKAWGRSA